MYTCIFTKAFLAMLSNTRILFCIFSPFFFFFWFFYFAICNTISFVMTAIFETITQTTQATITINTLLQNSTTTTKLLQTFLFFLYFICCCCCWCTNITILFFSGHISSAFNAALFKTRSKQQLHVCNFHKNNSRRSLAFC